MKFTNSCDWSILLSEEFLIVLCRFVWCIFWIPHWNRVDVCSHRVYYMWNKVQRCCKTHLNVAHTNILFMLIPLPYKIWTMSDNLYSQWLIIYYNTLITRLKFRTLSVVKIYCSFDWVLWTGSLHLESKSIFAISLYN